MPKCLILSGHKIIKILISLGFEIVGQKSSHVRLKKKEEKNIRIVVVPLHKEVAIGTFGSILNSH